MCNSQTEGAQSWEAMTQSTAHVKYFSPLFFALILRSILISLPVMPAQTSSSLVSQQLEPIVYNAARVLNRKHQSDHVTHPQYLSSFALLTKQNLSPSAMLTVRFSSALPCLPLHSHFPPPSLDSTLEG